MDNKSPQKSTAAQIGIIAGVVLIFYGVIRLLEQFVGPAWWAVIENGWSTFLAIAWPVAFISLGIYLVWAVKKGKFKTISLDSAQGLRRSQTDKRILGVCGGVAEFLHIDSTITRVLAVVFFVVSPWFALIVYFVAAILMPNN